MSVEIRSEIDPFALAEALSGVHLIKGNLEPAAAGETFDVPNPATREIIGQAARGDAQDVDRAVRIAREAQKAWARVPAPERGKMVSECALLLDEHAEELACLVSAETGKAIRTECRPEASVFADVFRHFGGLGSELKGETLPFRPDVVAMTVREPLGVVGAIIPWNVPLLLMALKVAPALVAGNSVVLKSSEEAPFGVLRAVQIMNEVLPPGVMNVLSGFGPECGAPLVSHAGVNKVSFTGSVATGREINVRAAERLIPVTLELGGKSPMIVMEDADLERAVEGAVVGMRFTRQGQSCTACSRIFVHERLHDAFVARLKDRLDGMRMGDPLEESTDIGAIISEAQFEKVRRYIEVGKASGATAHECSALPTESPFTRGLFVRPVIFTHISTDCPTAVEEVFGPVTCVFSWSDYERVIAEANRSEYGLAATVWTRDMKTALDATHRLEAGFVQVNQNLVVQPGLSYGGVKNSGLGKEASRESMLEHFTHKKTILLNMN